MEAESLKSNVEKEKKIISELILFSQEYENSDSEDGKLFYKNAAMSLLGQMIVLNDAIPSILARVSSIFSLPAEKKPEIKARNEIPQQFKFGERISTEQGMLVVSKGDKDTLLESLKIEKEALEKVRKDVSRRKEEKPQIMESFRKPSAYVALSNKFFGNSAASLTKNPFFSSLDGDLKKANMLYLLSSYISIILFTTFLVFICSVGIAVAIALLASKTNLAFALFRNIMISLAAPVAAFFIAYAYPSSEASSLRDKIDNEIPFGIMHMSAIAGSGIEPSKIFKIIAMSKEYENLGKEIRKILNEINVYGYDLTTALQSVSKTTSSKKLSDLLNGMATTTSTGGDLQAYLEKRASDAMTDYRLERRKYAAMAATYADIYTGLLIAAPLIFMLLLVIINTMGGTVGGFQTSSIAIFGIIGIIIVNIIFLVFLNLSSKAEI
jgi:flagellar protein FlaJ